jgi:hypothetical protein
MGCDAESFAVSGRFLTVLLWQSLGLVPVLCGAARRFARGTESAPATLRPSGRVS